MSENINIEGSVEVEVIDAKTGEVIEVHKFKNLLTNLGKRLHSHWAAGIAPIEDSNYNVDTRITHFAVGDGNSAPGVTQTSLDNELLRKELYPTPDAGCGITVESDGVVLFEMLIDETELNGETIKEMGLFSETFTTFMISRFLTGSLSKTSSVQFRIKYRYKYQTS